VKTLGLIGGMSWESTALYYRELNRIARQRLGGQHSAALILWSVDFAPIVRMQETGRWDEATAILVDAARRLEAAGAEGLLICANTMHKMADEVAAAVSIPLIHLADAAAVAVKASGSKRPLLLATRYTMEQDFYRGRLARGGVEAVIPEAAERAELQAIIYNELIQGNVSPAAKAALLRMIHAGRRDQGADGVVLACTELGLLLKPGELDIPVLDTTLIHAEAAMAFALGG
jgi:aspartate racemase